MKWPEPPRFADPRRLPFSSPLHHQRVAAVLGVALGIAFFTCFFTGLVSHTMQHPTGWAPWGARPAGLYRVTQGLHVLSGIVAVPLLLAKLWTVFPKLFAWPPFTGVAQLLERLSLPFLIGGAFFQLLTGIANISQWYFFPFFFTTAHYAAAWVTIGALVIHIGAKATIVRAQLRRRSEPAAVATGVSRRAFLASVFGAGGVVAFFTAGQSFSPLGNVAFLAPRKPGIGPQLLPVNKTAAEAGVQQRARDTGWTLQIEGAVTTPLALSLAALRAFPQRTAELPISCVEGWSASATWSGVPVRDLLQAAGANERAQVRVESMEEGGLYRTSILMPGYAQDPDTLFALDLNGEPLDIDHGFPCRLMAPNHPGVMQTKWVNRMVVL